MKHARDFHKNAVTGVVVTDKPEGLTAINRTGCAGVIWRRQPSVDFQQWIDGLDPNDLPRTRVTLRPNKVRQAMSEVCAAIGIFEGEERTELIDDIAALADIFASQMKAPFLQVRLEAITTNACKKFHVDALTARLICTYRGTGTQYGISQNGEAPARIFTVPTGAPILLTGTEWPDRNKTGLLHRSPPIEGLGETRLVLVLDPIQDPAPSDVVMH